MTLEAVPGAVKTSCDVLSAGIVIGTLAQMLPHIAAILTIVWTLIRIYETDLVQRLVRRGQENRNG
ncbi:hypothetical protein [uncultured Sphingomonas sp.]|mgnify:CR=1 FL=1|uniref:hypothetical protein n=1 Tax=uncultured Sphingomonas sp. TaxID=158754 RepID=UPI0025829FDA|nr:hypothetical protein [uncultured Sphingomonas sp.]